MIQQTRKQKAATLQRRLKEGWDMIEEAHRRGEDIRKLEAHWLRLMAEYELLTADSGCTE